MRLTVERLKEMITDGLREEGRKSLEKLIADEDLRPGYFIDLDTLVAKINEEMEK